MTKRVALLAISALAAATALAGAQSWPNRPVTMVVPFAAGGEPDVLGRILAQRLAEMLGKSVVVENVSGGGGTTGTARVAKAPPDGYQILFGGRGQFVTQSMSKMPPYSTSDFAPVVLVAETPILLVARHDLPVTSLADFISYARANHAQMQFGSPGAGSTPHLTCALLNAAIGVNVTHVPYRSGNLAMQDLLAGRIDYQCTGAATAMSQIEGKRLKAIAMLTKDHSEILPNLASAHEQGLTDFDASVWYGLFLAKATPAAIVGRLHDATVAAMDEPVVQERMREGGAAIVAPARRSPDYLRAFVEREIKKWAAVAKTAGVAGE
jgi:tripartite-type tricarboxylate transporter receptor subunit TctC